MLGRDSSNHPGANSAGVCHSCGKHFCKACLTEQGVFCYCKADDCQAVAAKDVSMGVQVEKATRVDEEKRRRTDFIRFLKSNPNSSGYAGTGGWVILVAFVGCLKWFLLIGFLYWIIFVKRKT